MRHSEKEFASSSAFDSLALQLTVNNSEKERESDCLLLFARSRKQML